MQGERCTSVRAPLPLTTDTISDHGKYNSSIKTATQSPTQKDAPLVDDIRFLGRILGEVIRDQEGKAAFALIENIRQLSVAFRHKADANADKALKKLLKSLSGDQTVTVCRAFTYFSHLANLAEDRHHIRRRAVHEREGQQQPGSLAQALQKLDSEGVGKRHWSRHWRICTFHRY